MRRSDYFEGRDHSEPLDEVFFTPESSSDDHGTGREETEVQHKDASDGEGAFHVSEASSLFEPYTEAAPFWHTPPEPGNFFGTPLYVHTRLPDVERIVQQAVDYLKKHGDERSALTLELGYAALVKNPSYQYEEVRRQEEPRLAELQKRRENLEQAIATTKREMARLLASAGIGWSSATLPKFPRRSKQSTRPLFKVWENVASTVHLLRLAAPSEQEVCGKLGITPMPSASSVLGTVGRWLGEIIWPLLSGLVMGVNLGTVTGLLSLEVIQRGESLWLVAVAALLGLSVEKLVGTIWYNLMHSWAVASEIRHGFDTEPPIPGMRLTVWRFLFACIAAVLTLGIVATDAIGLSLLFKEHLEQARLSGGGSWSVPTWVFFIVGTIVSAPYVIYKAISGWHHAETEQRRAHIRFRCRRDNGGAHRPEDFSSMLAQFLEVSQELESLYEQLKSVENAIKSSKARLDAAREEFVGSSQRFIETYWKPLIGGQSANETPESRHTAVSSDTKRPVNTLLGKLFSRFRR